MFDKLKRFISERAKWKKAGSVYRTTNEAQQLFEICKKCEHFKKKGPAEGSCGICGCRLTRSKEYFNKLAWATTRCPLEPPKWVEMKGFENIEVSEEEMQIEEASVTKEEQEQLNNTAAPAKKKCGCKN
jgi:hypothetical protein